MTAVSGIRAGRVAVLPAPILGSRAVLGGRERGATLLLPHALVALRPILAAPEGTIVALPATRIARAVRGIKLFIKCHNSPS